MSDIPPPPPGPEGSVPPPPPPPPPGPSSFPPPPPDSGAMGGMPPGGMGVPMHGGAAKAGFWQRFFAILLDGIIIAVPSAILAAILSGGGGSAFQALNNLFSLVIGAAYTIYFIGSEGQTLGKKALGVKVVDAVDGSIIGNGRAAGRYFMSIVSGFVCLLGYLWMLWDDNKQTWHDKVANSVVIKA